MKIDLRGKEIDFKVVLDEMDPSLRNKVLDQMAPCSHQELVDAYLGAHEVVFPRYFNLAWETLAGSGIPNAPIGE